MTTTTRNEAAEHVADLLDNEGWGGDSLERALEFERRATVERIQHAVLFQRNRLGKPPEQIRVTDLLAILDEVRDAG